VLVIDDTAVLKKGTHSVGVAPQYCSALGKIANCQTLVSLTLARDEVPVMAAMRLFLPESWMNDRARLKRAGVPAKPVARSASLDGPGAVRQGLSRRSRLGPTLDQCHPSARCAGCHREL
jgi:DDE superfamily endonuclease